MKKAEAKVLVTRVYESIIDRLDEEVNEAIVIDFLHDVAKELIKHDFDADLNYLPQTSFVEEYKALAEKSITSYSDTNEDVSKLAQEQQKTLEDLTKGEGSVDIDKFAERFTAVQDNLNIVVDKATSTLHDLNSRIKELETQVAIDPLTKIFNRRSLDKHLGAIFHSAEERQLDMFAMMIDIDDFKNVNDSYGHQVGDKVLIFIANLLKKTVRDSDKVFRFGGEEFIIILNRITHEQCMNVAQRMLHLAEHNKLISKTDQIHITLSIGLTAHKLGDTVETFIKRADDALYMAKTNGKNQLKVLA